MPITLRSLLLCAALLTAKSISFGQTLSYGAHINLAPVTIGSDTFSISARHVLTNAAEQRILNITVTPSGGAPMSYVMFVPDAQIITGGITKALAIEATNGSQLTEGDQSQPIVVEAIVMPLQANFLMLHQVDNTWTVTYGPAGHTQLNRRYTPAQLQQFVNYINLGTSFANALP
jgi:hypothetical protein